MKKAPFLLVGAALALTFGVTVAVAETPHDNPDNQLFTYGYSVPAGNGLETSVITHPNQAVDGGFKGRGYGAACANGGIPGPDCED